jgi:hypothetical protein
VRPAPHAEAAAARAVAARRCGSAAASTPTSVRAADPAATSRGALRPHAGRRAAATQARRRASPRPAFRPRVSRRPQVNVSLVGALLFTVSTSNLFGIDGYDWAFVEEKWGAATADLLHELQLVVAHTTSATNVIAALSSVVILMVNGELSSQEEFASFQALMGLRQSIGFQLLITSSMLTGILCVTHCVIFSYNNLASLIALPLFGLTTSVALFGSFCPAIDALYKVKYHTHTQKPVNVPVKALGAYIARFCAEYGLEHLTESAVLDLIAKSDTSSKMASILSSATHELLAAMVARTCAGYIDAQMKLEGDALVDGIVAKYARSL